MAEGTQCESSFNRSYIYIQMGKGKWEICMSVDSSYLM